MRVLVIPNRCEESLLLAYLVYAALLVLLLI